MASHKTFAMTVGQNENEDGKNQTKQVIDSSQSKSTLNLLVPPLLIAKMYLFEAHFLAAHGKPILIVGPTGTGKSLFLHLYKKLHEEKYGKDSPIYTVNCAHFGDSDLARSELFGHVKGSFTGATHDKTGWIKIADRGALILEEIGELSSSNQARMLTVIEDGFYSRVGENVMLRVKDLKIIGSTNKQEDEMRSDFWQRFFTFFVPPLHSRRPDILYYIAHISPELINELWPWEVLSLLCYNWPGNVRELDRVNLLIKRRQALFNETVYFTKYRQQTKYGFTDRSAIHFLDVEETGINAYQASILYNDLAANEIDVDYLESLLNYYGVGLTDSGEKKAFVNFSRGDTKKNCHDRTHRNLMNEYETRLGIDIDSSFEPFDKTFKGFRLFCSLFFQDPDADKNVLDVKHGTSPYTYFQAESLPKRFQKRYKRVAKSIFQYLSDIKLPSKEELPEDNKGRLEFLQQLHDRHPENKFLASILGTVGRNHVPSYNQSDQRNIFLMNKKDFNRYYYGELLKHHGTVKEVAKVLGVARSTVYSRCETLGLPLNDYEIL